MATLLVAGALANKCGNGGEAWVRLSWILGLRRLGHEVYFVEQIAPATCVGQDGAVVPFEESLNLDYFRRVTRRFGLDDRSALIHGERVHGPSMPELLEIAEAADLLVNISGHLSHGPLLRRVRRRAFVDIDPGFTQFWHVDPASGARVDGHDFHFTIGENIGSPACPIPTSGVEWRPVRQPVVLEEWPVAPAGEADRFTTLASWRGAFGPVEHQGRRYGLKVHEFRKFVELPSRARQRFEIALDIHPADGRDRDDLRRNGWRLVDPRGASRDPDAFRAYVQGSGAEFSVAQGIYVDTGSGWFSDRTVRYLASGKPALVQDTGFSRNLPTGEGLVAFRTLEEAVEGAERIARDYAAHCAAARAIAEEFFDSDRVLTTFLQEAGVAA